MMVTIINIFCKSKLEIIEVKKIIYNDLNNGKGIVLKLV